MNDQQLVRQISSKISSGQLPLHSEQQQIFGGRGDGYPCSCCGSLITAAHVQFEIEDGPRCLQMHLPCYNVWRRASDGACVRSGTELTFI